MNVHDEMSDNEVLRAASDSLSAVPMASPPGRGGDHGQGPRAPDGTGSPPSRACPWPASPPVPHWRSA